MPRKPAKTTRRTPRQERARFTVQAILDATAQILKADGVAGLNTNKVAKRAGVSVGSLYQYFPNKTALLTALHERHAQAQMVVITKVLDELGDDAPVDAVTRAAIDAMIGAMKVDPDLHRVLTRHRELSPEIVRVENEIAVQIVGILQRRATELRDFDVEVGTWMMIRGVEALSHAALLEHPEWIEDDRFAEELTDMILRYIS